MIAKVLILLFFTFLYQQPNLAKPIPIAQPNQPKKQSNTKLTAHVLKKKPTQKKKRRNATRKSTKSTEPQQNFAKTITHFVTPPQEIDPSKNCYIWESLAPHPFNELIISWNALRPSQGYLTFWTSVKYGDTWSPWHRMASWGASNQRSFINKLHQHVHTKHVLVEMQKNQLAQAFRVKVVFEEGAQLSDLHAIHACCSTLKFFKATPENAHYPSYKIKGIPKISQMLIDHERYQDLCAPTSLSMVTYHFNQKKTDKPLTRDQIYDYATEFADKVHDHGIDIYGNWQLNAAQAYDACDGTVFFRVERLNSFNNIYQLLTQNIPVIVSVRRLKGGATPYAHGHILVVVGWNAKNNTVICHDPAFKRGVIREYPLKNFSSAWALSKNLSYVAIPAESINTSQGEPLDILSPEEEKLLTALYPSDQHIHTVSMQKIIENMIPKIGLDAHDVAKLLVTYPAQTI